MEERLPRKLAAILYADVAGYSLLTGNDEDATHRKLGELLAVNPGFSVNAYLRGLPFKHEVDRQSLTSALLKAGVPQ